MKTHNYLTRINDDTWMDLQRVRELDNRSANSLINEGVRLVIADKLQKISQMKKHRNTLHSLFLDRLLHPNSELKSQNS